MNGVEREHLFFFTHPKMYIQLQLTSKLKIYIYCPRTHCVIGHRGFLFSILVRPGCAFYVIFFYVFVFVLCFVFLCLAWYGSQSEAAVNRCLWLRTILRQPVFSLWVVGSYFLFSVFCTWLSCFGCFFFVLCCSWCSVY